MEVLSNSVSGEKYQTLKQENVLGEWNQLSINCYLDGIPVDKKQHKYTPLLFTFTELPIEWQSKLKFCFILAIYFEDVALDCNLFLAPFVHQMRELTNNTDGPSCIVMSFIMDLIQKAQTLNVASPSGYFGFIKIGV